MWLQPQIFFSCTIVTLGYLHAQISHRLEPRQLFRFISDKLTCMFLECVRKSEYLEKPVQARVEQQTLRMKAGDEIRAVR